MGESGQKKERAMQLCLDSGKIGTEKRVKTLKNKREKSFIRHINDKTLVEQEGSMVQQHSSSFFSQ
ncbi:hypothetical protein [Metabacillus litoralis]|uniref:hypothetical protein n=1 Tax=Metabacillus litoralis TaxID=152268 RepID=UPI000EF61EEC|nr:hypothetical protein [Metabacillus litoralis]